MSYFSKFPKYLTHTTDNRQVIMTDFFRRIRTGQDFNDSVVGLIPYIIKEQETPEKVAYEFYGSAFYHWIILLVNDIVDVRQEWPLDYESFNAMITEKYDDINDIHHYVNTDNGYIVDADEENPNVIPVTNFEYETEVNDAKRTIRVLDSKFLQQFVTSFDALIGT